ncbi:hypothetical protein [Limnoglobus roseus]|uniref:Uncharacterized protein n=1 Tax=Limnoglobus roseus TaxID=2598579 RepID=A0A5C1AV22_9BACT|nr:hypothetical protein [Limnoglobus roseus]QEL21124.1 hypothetical protein PX52LOC_08254 [Limnoglobus roseus]
MRRRFRSFVLTAGLLTLLLGVVGSVLGSVLKQEPTFYQKLSDLPEWDNGERASGLMTRVQDLKNDVRSKADWAGKFHGDDVNAFCQENLCEGTSYANLLPKGFHSPRVVVEGDHIKLGLRYGHGFWSTVIWIELKAWLVKNDTNVIAVELCGFKAGGLSIGCQTLLDTLSEAAHDSNIEVSWYRHDGNPVGLFRFYADQLRPTTQIHTFKIEEGAITVAGRTRLENAQATAPGLNAVGD